MLHSRPATHSSSQQQTKHRVLPRAQHDTHTHTHVLEVQQLSNTSISPATPFSEETQTLHGASEETTFHRRESGRRVGRLRCTSAGGCRPSSCRGPGRRSVCPSHTPALRRHRHSVNSRPPTHVLHDFSNVDASSLGNSSISYEYLS